MPKDKDDVVYLRDAIDAINDILRFIEGIEFEEYQRNDLLRAATERKLEILGEASKNLSQEFRAAHDQVPWRNMIDLRNVIAHDYGELIYFRIWQVVTNHLPPILRYLREIMDEIDQ